MRGGFAAVAARALCVGSSAKGPRTAGALGGAKLCQVNCGFLTGIVCSGVPLGPVTGRAKAGAGSVEGGDSAKPAIPAGR